ncbi:MAG: PfkB family carbohydrate kinase [Bacteroidetes bacterium]|nr:PfkB family carbohydrate kinase [Bacteroidota bacterium]
MPSGLFLGGAPFNVAHDLHQLTINSQIISRVGNDILGHEILRQLALGGMSTDLLQIDDHLPTGLVEVTFDADKDPSYRIVEPSAWDYISADEGLVRMVSEARMLVFGTLACRNQKSRETLRTLLKSARMKVLDVNIRLGAISREITEELLSSADIVKVNSAELETLKRWFTLPDDNRGAAESIAKLFSCGLICISMGSDGGSMWHDGRWIHHSGFSVNVQSSVGAGDAFLAGLLDSLARGMSDAEILETANLLGAFTVTKMEAAPEFNERDLQLLRNEQHA